MIPDLWDDNEDLRLNAERIIVRQDEEIDPLRDRPHRRG